MNTKKLIIMLIVLILLIISIMWVIILKLNKSNQESEESDENKNIEIDKGLFDTGEATLEPETTVYRVNTSDMMFTTISNCIKDTFKVNYNIYIWDLFCLNRISTETYFAHIVTNKKESNYITINIDHDSSAYKIEKLSISDYENIIKDEVPEKYLEDIQVQKGNDNSINYTSLNEEEICKYYMEMINDLLINYPEAIYEKLADDYKEARFKTYEDFEKYCINRIDFVNQKEYMTYASGYINENKVYQTIDTKENIYMIEESTSDEMNIYLDNYTLGTEEFTRVYNESKDTLKAAINAEKFLKMLNNQDYSAIYSKLNNNYKNTNFPTEDSLKSYLTKEFYTTNMVKSSEVKSEGDYYLVTIDISEDTKASASSQRKKVIISLKEGIDFEMSIVL